MRPTLNFFFQRSTIHIRAGGGGDGRTCANAFRAADKYERNDGEVPFRFNLVVIF